MGRAAGKGFPSIPSCSTLNIDIELVSFKPVIDVMGDAKVFKKILEEGEGASADEGAIVTSKKTNTNLLQVFYLFFFNKSTLYLKSHWHFLDLFETVNIEI